ncbi:MAG TPA: alanine--tRNA ligase-related protein, partial [Candidatus Nanopelagicales bacterium]|nr:alanine--tRNA ligase-related protein [Candidatus Nanopelagicales bacterium]
RGYVLRRIVRRAVRHGRLLGRREPFLAETVATVIDVMGEAYPIVRDEQERILAAVAREEAQFARTLDAGTAQLEEALIPLTDAERAVGRRPEEVPADAPVIPGAFAFKLHDTYGFPIDLTIELAAEYGVRVDREGFEVALAEQRQRSRGGRKAELARHAELTALYESIVRRGGDTTFLGYETTEAEGTVVAIVRDGVAYDELTGHGEAEVVLDRTPFYAEGGGQVGDRGEIAEPGGGSPLFTVTDTQKPSGGLIVHRGTLHGRLRVGKAVAAAVDAERRARTMRNHTATHLLHRALRNVAGPSAKQAGSLVSPDYLRFDYPLDRALTDDEKLRIEDEVRGVVRDDRPVSIAFLSMPEAIEAGADAFFDEKYGETVRTIRVRDYSFELCGGTHCRASGQIGSFVITGDRSIGSGMRRIEALTGDGADAHLRERGRLLEAVADRLGAPSTDAVLDRVAALETELRETKRRLREGGGGVPRPADLAARADEVAPGIRLVAHAGPWASIDAVKSAAKEVRALLGSGVVALALDADEPQVFVTVSDDLVARGVAAGDLVRAAMAALEGKGGGRPEMAQGKGSRRDGLPAALASISAALAAAAAG